MNENDEIISVILILILILLIGAGINYAQRQKIFKYSAEPNQYLQSYALVQ